MSCWVRFRSPDAQEGFGTRDGAHVAVYQGEMFGAARPTGRRLAPHEYSLLAPCAPSKIIALWNNFHALAAKLGKQPPAHPLYFIKPSTCINAPHELIRRPVGYAGKILYEGELGIVIGRRCTAIEERDAHAAIFGYTCINDVTASDILAESADFTQWCRAKGFDTFGCIGPAIATDFDWQAARLATLLDGVVRQDYPLSDMILPPARLVARLSQDMTLLPGDVIACGTSVGVGSIREGATVEVRIEGIGSLSNVLAPR